MLLLTFTPDLNLRIEDWADLLETNEEGDTVYPDQGVSGYCYSPEGEEFSRKTRIVEEVLSFSQKVMIRFLMSLPAREQLILSQEARSTFLKNPEALESHYGNQDQEQEEERDREETVNNGENFQEQ